LWVILILECLTFPCHNRPRLTDNASSSRDSDRRRDDVGPSVKEDDLATSILEYPVNYQVPSSMNATDLLKDRLDSSSIIRLSITLRTVIPDADELANSIIGILGVRLAEYSALIIKQHSGLVGRVDVALRVFADREDALVNIPLTPRLDCLCSFRAAFEYNVAGDRSDYDINIGELGVVKDD